MDEGVENRHAIAFYNTNTDRVRFPNKLKAEFVNGAILRMHYSPTGRYLVVISEAGIHINGGIRLIGVLHEVGHIVAGAEVEVYSSRAAVRVAEE